MDRTTFPPPVASEHIAPALTWAEQNLTALATYTAASIDGGDGDHLHLASVFAILRARQAVRAGRQEQERLAREVAR